MKSILLALLLASISLPACAQDPYNEKPLDGRSRVFHVQHIKLQLAFDLPARKLMGTATLRLAPLSSALREVILDSAELAIESVTIEGRPLRFHSDDETLHIALDRRYPSGKPITLTISYHAQPKRGLFFIMPDRNHPNRPQQLWAQGDTAGGNNRFWFPGYDFPNDKATTEMLVTVPAGWETVSNGRLTNIVENENGTRTFHWLQNKPISSYLISLVAGEFDKREDKWKVPVAYYAPRGRGDDLPRTFGRTTQILDFFSANIAPYPWAKYSQIAVDTFNGGMENVSATTMGTNYLIDAARFEDDWFDTDAEIAHEMAHQWFGDLVTCTDWRDSWLNEGFATYFEALWEEHAHGRDYFDWIERQANLKIASKVTDASVVPNKRSPSYDLVGDKGGWILQMVRGQLGDELFWKAIRHYTRKYSFKNATTNDFVKAITESTGRNLAWLFDQYVYKPGVPQFDVSWTYDENERMVSVHVKQTQKADGATTPFHLPVEFEVLGDSAPRTFRVWVNKESEDFSFSVPDRPRTVLFDPRDILLKALNFVKPASEWIWQLEHAPRALNRSEAATVLGSFSTPDVIAALDSIGSADSFFGVRLSAISALGRIATEETREPITRMLADKDIRVRTAAVYALESLKGDGDRVARLLQLARNDPSYAVRQTALGAIVRIKPANALELVTPFLDVDSPGQRVQSMAIAAQSRLGNEAAVPRLLAFSHDSNDRVRRTALQAFGSLGKGQPAVLERLLEALDDKDTVDRLTAIAVLSQRNEQAARQPLQHLADTETLPNVARAARAALESLHPIQEPSK